MNCPHTVTQFVATPELKHHGKDVCAACGRFVRWVAKPETLEREAQNKKRIGQLCGIGRISAWEKSFLESVSSQPKLSPRQQVVLDKLWEKYG